MKGGWEIIIASKLQHLPKKFRPDMARGHFSSLKKQIWPIQINKNCNTSRFRVLTTLGGLECFHRLAHLKETIVNN